MLGKMVKNEITIHFVATVYGAMVYRSTFDRKVRHTPFIYFAEISNRGVISKAEGGVWETFPADRMVLHKWNIGWSAT